jgi:hypothetical protein
MASTNFILLMILFALVGRTSRERDSVSWTGWPKKEPSATWVSVRDEMPWRLMGLAFAGIVAANYGVLWLLGVPLGPH